MARLFFIGDSITAGAWDTGGGWANRMIGHIMGETIQAGSKKSTFYCMPYNLGVSGNAVPDVLKRVKNEVNARVNVNETVQIVFSVGVKDSIYLVKENKPLFSDEEFRKNLTALIDLSLGMTPNVSFIGVLPVNEALLNPIPWTPDKAYVNTSIKRIEDIIGAICASYKLPFYPLFQRWIEMKDYTDFFIDGIHPNSKGHALLAEQLKIFLLTEDFFKIHSPVR